VATGNQELEDSREYEQQSEVVDRVAKQPTSKSDPDQEEVNVKKDNLEPARVSQYILRKRSDTGIRSN
jgi:hypothetical protein